MKKFFSKIAQRAFALAISIMVVTNTFAQGAAGIDAASSELATYMDPLGNMMMILGGLVGLVGAVRVYLKWNSGDQDVQKAVMGWMMHCLHKKPDTAYTHQRLVHFLSCQPRCH